MREDFPSRRGDLVALDGGWRMWPLAALRSAALPFASLKPLARAGTEASTVRMEAAETAALGAFLLDDTYRAALTWQNPAVLTTWGQSHVAALRSGGSPTLNTRRRALLARYAQRYCTKNDTVGFFGPVAWARLGGDGTRVVGDGALSRAEVHLETWAVHALARAWNAERALRPHLPVRLAPACSVTGTTIRRPLLPPIPLDEPARLLLKRLPCTVGDLEHDSPLPLWDLHDQNVLQVGFLVPLDGSPQAHLRRQIEAIPDARVHDRLLAVLDDLEDARSAVARAGDPADLLTALTGVELRLSDMVGQPVRRGPELASGGRTPVYLDSRRDLDAVIGKEQIAALAGPLSVLLDSARWLAGQVGEAVEEALRERYRWLRRGRAEVSLAEMQLAGADMLSPGSEAAAAVMDDFHARWAEILPDGAADVALDLETVRGLADVLFPPTGRLWTAALTHSPDLMPRRTAAGELRWVLGELHVALTTLENRAFLDQADDPQELVDLVAFTMPQGRVVPVYPSTAPAVSSRTYPPLALDPPGHYRYWSYAADEGHPTGVASTPATALLVTERDGRLIAECDTWAAPVLECFGEFVTAVVVNMFRLRPQRGRAPRVDLGPLTICRRSWHVRAAEVAVAAARTSDPRHHRLRQWAADQGIPRHVFVKTPMELKPFYVNLDAPVLVDSLARAIRRMAPDGMVELVEMLPAPDELWLADPEGSRFTAELRMVAVAPSAPVVSSWPVRDPGC